MNYKGYALFCDLHQVLLDAREKPSPAVREAVERFTSGGGRFGVIAESSPATVAPLLQEIPTNTWSVVLGGAEACRFDRMTVAFPRVISQLSLAAFLRQVISMEPNVSILLYSESRLFCLSDPALLDSRFRHGKPPYDVVGLETALRFPWLGVRFFGPETELDAVERYASGWGIYDLAECIHDEPGSCYFMPRGVSKERCISDLRCLDELRDLKMVIIGSRSSDAGFLHLADFPIAAPGASQAVRKAARYQIPDAEPDPLGYVIDRLLPTL